MDLAVEDRKYYGEKMHFPLNSEYSKLQQDNQGVYFALISHN